MSAPAQKAFPPAPSNQTALALFMLGSSLLRARIMSVLSELRTLGLLSTTLVNDSYS